LLLHPGNPESFVYSGTEEYGSMNPSGRITHERNVMITDSPADYEVMVYIEVLSGMIGVLIYTSAFERILYE